MKKKLYEILDSLTPEEIDTLPEEFFPSETLDDVTVKRIQHTVAEKSGLTPVEANADTQRTKRASRLFGRIAATAACLSLLLGAGTGAYAYTAAKKEYKNALTFFYENELSTEGLTKKEIKEVYRDFSSCSFSNDLTTDVLLNSRPDVVKGYEITGDNSKWDTSLPDTLLSDYKTPVYYEYEVLYNPIEGTYNPETKAYKESFNKSIFSKYRNGEKIWEISFTDLAINGYYGDPESDTDPVLVYGTEPYTVDVDDGTATLLALNADGTVLWKVVQNNSVGSGSDLIDAVVSHPDGSYTAFGRCSDKTGNFLSVNKYSNDGTQIFTNIVDISDHTIENVALTESGYLMHLSSYVISDFARVLKLDLEGNLVGDFSYESEDNDFYIADFCEYNGTVYISGHITEKAPRRIVDYGKREVFILRSELADGKTRSDEELLDLFRNNFTAVLLVCEPDSGTPKEFYSVAGSLGDEVYVSNGSVCWFTKDIIASSYSAKSIQIDSSGVTTTNPKLAALCRFYANIFNTDGSFKEQKKLDLMTQVQWGK